MQNLFLRHTILFIIAFFSLLCFASPIYAQKVGDDAFMRNNWIEAGFSKSGTFGSYGAAPAGYHPRNNINYPTSTSAPCPSNGSCLALGFVADPNGTDWKTYYGDFFLPATDYEGFSVVYYEGTDIKNFSNKRNVPSTTLPGIPQVAVNGLVVSPSLDEVIWTGEVANAFRLVNTHKIEGKVIVNSVTITNLSSATRTYYISRSVDPDNQASKGSGYITTNTIESQGDGNGKIAWVSASASDGSCVSYVSKQGNALVAFGSSFGSIILDPKKVWDNPSTSTSTPYTKEGFSNTTDTEIGIVFKVDNVAPGASATISFEIRLDQPPIVSFTGSSLTKKEGERFTYTLNQQYVPEQQVTVKVKLSGGTGITKEDFSGVISGGTTLPVSALPMEFDVVIPSGQTTATFDIDAAYDALLENNETFTVEIISVKSDVGGLIGTPKSLTGTIVDVPLPVATISTSTATINEAGETEAILTVTLSKAPITEVGAAVIDVQYQGTATFTDDYTIIPGTNASSATRIVIPVGQTTASFKVKAKADNIYEPGNETVIPTLVASDKVVVGTPGSSTITIVDSNTAPVLSMTEAVAVDEGQNMVYTLVLTGDECSKDITVSYATSNGTAVQPADYTAISGVATFAPGESSKSLTVVTKTDKLVEGDENLTLTLSSPVNCTFPGSKVTVVGVGTINDITDAKLIVVKTKPELGNASENSPKADGKFRLKFEDDEVTTTKKIAVKYTVTDTRNTDTKNYTIPISPAVIAVGSNGVDVDVQVLDNSIVEGARTLVVKIVDFSEL